MSQHLYTSISVFRYWQNAAKLTEQKVRCERETEVQSFSHIEASCVMNSMSST
jgi:hypothetical protein